MSRRLRDQPCTYCGADPPSERDHIPPANLFGNPPSNLITVPACSTCNRQASQDDEYFRNMLAFREGFDQHPEMQVVLPAAHRSLLRPEAAGMARAFVESAFAIKPVDSMADSEGLKLGYKVDLARLDRVVTRVMKGLYFRHLGRRIPSEYGVRSFCGSGLQHVDSTLGPDLARFVTTLTAGPSTTVGQDVFSYWFHTVPDEANAAAAFFMFYEREWFLSLVARDGDLETRESGE